MKTDEVCIYRHISYVFQAFSIEKNWTFEPSAKVLDKFEQNIVLLFVDNLWLFF